MIEVSEECYFSKHPFRKLRLLGGASDHLDRHRLARDLVCGRATGCNSGRPQGVSRAAGAHITYPYAPEPISRMSFHLFSTWNGLPNEDMSVWYPLQGSDDQRRTCRTSYCEIRTVGGGHRCRVCAVSCVFASVRAGRWRSRVKVSGRTICPGRSPAFRAAHPSSDYSRKPVSMLVLEGT